MPVILAGNEAQKTKYLGRMMEEPLMCVSMRNNTGVVMLVDVDSTHIQKIVCLCEKKSSSKDVNDRTNE